SFRQGAGADVGRTPSGGRQVARAQEVGSWEGRPWPGGERHARNAHQRYSGPARPVQSRRSQRRAPSKVMTNEGGKRSPAGPLSPPGRGRGAEARVAGGQLDERASGGDDVAVTVPTTHPAEAGARRAVGAGQRKTRHLGSALRSSSTPASVTIVLLRVRDCS